MGAYSELDAALKQEGAAFEESTDTNAAFQADPPAFDDDCPWPQQLDQGGPQHEEDAPPAQAEDRADMEVSDADEDAANKPAAAEVAEQLKEKADEDARAAHEAAEAKRKAEWEARQLVKKEQEEAALKALLTMSDQDVMKASMKRIGADTEKLTRRNMKLCVSEYIQTMCLDNAEFARRAMHPRKSMVHCFWYINRKAREYIEQEMKDNDTKPGADGVYGSDVPDELCFQWAMDYYNDPAAKEDQGDEEKFVPRPFYGRSTTKNTSPKKEQAKKKEEKKPALKKPKVEAPSDQITMGDLSLFDEKAS